MPVCCTAITSHPSRKECTVYKLTYLKVTGHSWQTVTREETLSDLHIAALLISALQNDPSVSDLKVYRVFHQETRVDPDALIQVDSQRHSVQSQAV